MRKLLFVGTIVALAAFAMATHECTHDPPGGGCVNHPQWPGNGSTETCVGGGANQPPPTPVPTWAAQPYGNHVPHVANANVIPVMLTYDVYLWDADWAAHYFDAVGFWNDNLNNSVLHDETVIEDARVWVVRPGSTDEVLVNAFVSSLDATFYGGNSCHTGNPGVAWATVNFAKQHDATGHTHHEYQKICIWGSSTPIAPKELNPYGDHYWWLTLTHELGHVFSLDHKLFGQCVMQDGFSMISPCPSEITWVDQHYGL